MIPDHHFISGFDSVYIQFIQERVNEIPTPLWDFQPSDFQRALTIITTAELFTVMTTSPGQLRHNNSDNAENAHSRSYVLNDLSS